MNKYVVLNFEYGTFDVYYNLDEVKQEIQKFESLEGIEVLKSKPMTIMVSEEKVRRYDLCEANFTTETSID